MTEPIIKKSFPAEFPAPYQTTVECNLKHFFYELDKCKTLWEPRKPFKPDSFGMKIIDCLMPGVLNKQSLKHMQYFKNVVEDDKYVAE